MRAKFDDPAFRDILERSASRMTDKGSPPPATQPESEPEPKPASQKFYHEVHVNFTESGVMRDSNMTIAKLRYAAILLDEMDAGEDRTLTLSPNAYWALIRDIEERRLISVGSDCFAKGRLEEVMGFKIVKRNHLSIDKDCVRTCIADAGPNALIAIYCDEDL